MMDRTYLKAHRTAASWRQKHAPSRETWRTRGGLNSKLHAVCDGTSKPLLLLVTRGLSAITRSPGRAAVAARCQDPDCRSRLRQRPLAERTGGSKNPTLHSRPKQPQAGNSPQPGAVPATQSDRTHVRTPQGLATHRNSIRPMRTHLLQRYLPRGNRHLSGCECPDPGPRRNVCSRTIFLPRVFAMRSEYWLQPGALSCLVTYAI